MDHLLRWHLPHGIRVVMTLASDGDLRDPTARSAWCARNGVPDPVVAKQVHGIRVLVGPAFQPPFEADAIAVPGHGPIGVFGADCPPLVLAASDAFAVAHCGWRGTAAGIVSATIEALRGLSRHPPASWTALVGPGIHPDDYEVDAPVLSARTWPAGTVVPGRPGRAWLDLPAAVAADAARAGVASVARTPLTTSRDPRLHSHRRDGSGPPQLLVAWRDPCAG